MVEHRGHSHATAHIALAAIFSPPLCCAVLCRDDRLTPLSKLFFSTAKAVSSLVGAGRAVGGALEKGKASVHSAIDQLMHKWEQALHIGHPAEREEHPAVTDGAEV